MSEARPEPKFQSQPPRDTDLGPVCEALDCTTLAVAKYKDGPWLCDDHEASWLDEDRDRLISALVQVAQDCAHLAWQHQGRQAKRDFERVGRIAEGAING